MAEGLELMEKLREARKAKNLSYQDIVDITEANGEAVSPSTVRRIFQEEAKLEDFRYHQTVRPIIRAVLGMDEETEKPAAEPTLEQAKQYYATIEGLKAVAALKNSQLVSLHKENERLASEVSDMKVDRKEQIAEIKEDYQKKVEYLKRIVDDLQSSIKWYKRVIAILGITAGLFFAALIIDLTVGSFGWIRY